MERPISFDTGALYRLGDQKKILEIIKEAGFDYYDATLYWKGVTENIGVGDDYREKALAYKEEALKLGLKCTQAHAYFTRGIEPEAVARRIEYIKKDIEIASILGAKLIVIHPIWEFNEEQNIEFLNNFIPLAHKFNILLGIENIFGETNGKPSPMVTSKSKDFISLLNKLNDPYVVACVDIGHAEMEDCGEGAANLILALGNRVQALHIHDNNQKNDLHQIPYCQHVDFDKVLQALKTINYQGDITFEADRVFGKIPFELYPSYVRLLKDIGVYFKKYLEN